MIAKNGRYLAGRFLKRFLNIDQILLNGRYFGRKYDEPNKYKKFNIEMEKKKQLLKVYRNNYLVQFIN